MRKSLWFSLLMLSAQVIFANTDVRTWNGEEGSFSAELITYNAETGVVTFKDGKGEDFQQEASSLSTIDQAWLKEWDYVSDHLAEKIEKFGGELEHLMTKGEHPTDLYIYHPSSVEKTAQRPMLLLFQSGGKAQRYLLRFVEAAEELGIVVVGCGTFRNTGPREESLPEEEKLLTRFREVLPQIEANVAHAPKQMMMGGNSGGAWRAFHYSAQVERPWLGIFSNGGWLGTERYWELPYPAMRVAIVNGNNDRANRWIDHNTKILTERKSEVAVFSFEGGHQNAPAEHTSDALSWMLNRDEE